MSKIRMTEAEVEETRAVISELAGRYASVEDQDFLDEANVMAHELPRRIRRELRNFRLFEPEGAMVVVRGWPVDEGKIGPTPPHWNDHGEDNDTLSEDILLVLLSSLLGEPIGWSTQQGGRIVHDLLPIKGHENEQVGTGSGQLITWHVEDAFHPYRGDYLGMMCLRNPDQIPTTFAPISSVPLTDEEVEVLSRPLYVIRPDNSHLPKNADDTNERTPEEAALVAKSFEKIERMCTSPEPISILFGDLKAPYVRMDPYFMETPEDPVARDTFETLQSKVDEVLEDRALEPGDICFIDNFQSVHGRKPFKARFDGSDRWMKRINVARDLRKSRESRLSASARVVY